MEWALGLSTGPGGFGSAVSLRTGRPGAAHLIGVFPTMARAVSAAAAAAPDAADAPARVVLVHPSGIHADELGRDLGDLALAGVTGDDIELRSDVEVLTAVTGDRVLLIDADRDLLAGHPGKTAPFDADRLAELVASDPFGTTVALTGHPEVRDRYHVAARDYAPLIVERPALAALALDNPTTSTLVSTPRTSGALAHRPRRAMPYLLVIITGLVIFLLLLVVIG
ncbi:hypothetical protein [Corynebacterium halotolerans]|uniref:Uncharacterized protein n=1 Tax=Corynebacterium halotolerans YIM 70093 = DSM 44683 TaxID=1121362 RepID=M1P554_9CORY|nr:hypothetical protein [Corynebacterium halotolerans]AGF71801.1 hypothetical protein A605_03950 [Corynebacterium halotolerans YIM 70093 = DSM 44683]